MAKDYDVIIIGAGIAGCEVARRLIDEGLNVLILESSKRVKNDSGIVSIHFPVLVGEKSKRFIRSEISSMEFIGPDSETVLHVEEPFAYLIDREMFGKWMRKRVKKNISFEYVKGVKNEGNVVKVSTDSDVYECAVAVGADGALSICRRAAGINPPKMRFGLFFRGKPRKGDIRVWLDKDISKDGFLWEIPKNGEIGLISTNVNVEKFRKFCTDIGVDIRECSGGPIPLGTCRSYSNRMILVGDAAGQVKPITGGGIILSLMASQKASSAILNSFRKNRFNSDELSVYEHEWKADFGNEIFREILMWKLYHKMSNFHISKIMRFFGREICMKSFDYDLPSMLVVSMFLRRIYAI